jgi:hypothetical protein
MRNIVVVPVPLMIKATVPRSSTGNGEIDANIGGKRVVGFCKMYRIEPNACVGMSFGVKTLVGT